MVNTSSNSKKENNRVIISNNKAKYYSDLAQTYANQSKNYSDIAKAAQEAVNSIVDADDLSTIADNIDDIKDIAENLDSLTAETTWGSISGTLDSQADLKAALDAKADTEDLAEIATSGSYNDLSDKPTIPDVSNLATKTELQSKADTSDLSAVATSGSYNDLSDKPTIPSQYTLPTASETTLGGVKVDGSSITISDGVISASVSGGTMDYSALSNKPKINNIELSGNKTLADLGIQAAGNYLTSVPSEYITESELNSKNYLTDSDLTSYALKSEIPTVPANITTQGNSFNGANQLVKLDASGKLPAIDGSQLTNIQAGMTVTVDNALSTTSTNPVQNKVITDALQGVISSQNSISATSGTINIELCKNYNLSITGNTVFNITASDSESDIFPEQTLIQVDYKSKSASISFQCSGSNITRYFNDNTPVFDKVGTYDIVIERYGKSNNLSNNDLTIGVIFTGEYSSGGTGDGGYGW